MSISSKASSETGADLPSVIVRDDGFSRDDGAVWLEITAETDLAALAALRHAPAIRIRFPVFSDGRGFTLSAALRRAGFTGRLRAAGPLLADQYAMARRAGFDEVEIPAEIAARQPEGQWRARSDWRARDYRSRLRPTG